jgi:acyl-CoA thioesterase-1
MPSGYVTPPNLMSFKYGLPRTERRLSDGTSLVIVALGSSSTAGAGASSADAAYPTRLAAELRERYGSAPITVLNRGVNSEDVSEMLVRLDADVISHRPDLVIWQLGTNWLLQDRPLSLFEALVRDGINRLATIRADIVLIDPQFVPQVIAKPDLPALVRLVSDIGEEFSINVFRRYASMRYWREVAGIPFETFIAEDGLHMNDWGYDAMAKLLAGAIAQAAATPATES